MRKSALLKDSCGNDEVTSGKVSERLVVFSGMNIANAFWVSAVDQVSCDKLALTALALEEGAINQSRC